MDPSLDLASLKVKATVLTRTRMAAVVILAPAFADCVAHLWCCAVVFMELRYSL
jgi:hypothetical protein